MADRRYESLVLVSLLFGAFALRLITIIFSIDVGGDGPMHAIKAHNWSQSPYIAVQGNDLPALMYLAGAVNFVVGSPLYSARILNLIIGTLTVPLFYLLVHKVWGHATAIFSASILLFLPLHVGLSASSLTEATFLFTVVAGMVFLIRASADTKHQKLRLSLAILCFCLAAMTRYEAWLLMPLFPFYYFWKTRNVPTATLMALALLIFPTAWMVGNYFYEGDFLPAFSSNTKSGPEAVGAQAVDLLAAAKIIRWKSVHHLGWILFVAALWGAILQLAQALRRKTDPERALYIFTGCVFWMFMLYFAMSRGESLWDRYLLFGLVMALPFALLPFVRYVNRNNRLLALIICLGVVSAGVSELSYRRPEVYVTPWEPVEIKRIAAWLKESPYREDPILLSKMGWKSTYLPLYFPQASSRFLVVSFWTEDSRLQDFLKNRQPSLLITRDGDDEFQSRIEALLGKRIRLDRPLHTEDTIKIYVIER